MQSYKNNRLLRAIRHESVDATPVWIMRQAGRYLPEYRATRERAGSFMQLSQTPELAAEVTLQPLARFDLDAAIIFSDILTIPDAMGLGLSFTEGKGPAFAKPVRDALAIEKLQVPNLTDLSYVYAALRLVTKELAGKVPVIGFCGSPWTLAAYMVEGQSNPGFPALMHLKQTDPAAVHHLLSLLAEAVAAHLNAQIEAGAGVGMIFDTWGGLLNDQDYEAFSLAYAKLIIDELARHYNKKDVPIILFTKGGQRWLPQMATSGCSMIGVDWNIGLNVARAQVGQKVALQGNMDPAILLTDPATIRQEVKTILQAYGKGSGHVFNLGHGITPDVPPEHVSVLVDAVHEFSQPFHE